MATVLNKDITRESTLDFEGRKIMVTLSEDQKIVLKLKGMKSGGVSINILDLLKQLKGVTGTAPVKPTGSINVSKDTEPKSTKKNPTILLNDLRSFNAISTLDTQTMVKFDGIINDLLKSQK